MNLRFRHLFQVLIAAMAAMASVCACTSADGIDDTDTPAVRPAATLGFVISMGDTQEAAPASALSRVTPGDGPYDPGAGFENYIHIESEPSDVAVYLFDGNGAFLLQAAEPTLVRLNSYPSAKTYELHFSVGQADRDLIDGGALKVVLLANWRQYPVLTAGSSTIADISAAAEAEAAYMPRGVIASADDRIPLFGVIHTDSLQLLPSGNTTWLGTLHLLRAVAKVTVTDSDLLAGVGDGLRISTVELVRYNTRTIKAPAGVTHQDHYVKGSYVKDYLDQVTVPAGTASEATTPVAFAEISTGVWQIYCPEYLNEGRAAPAQRSRIRVTYSDNAEFYVDFKYYQGSKKDSFFNVQRNNWYQFDIMRGVAVINCEVRVLPYSIVDLQPEFGTGIGKPFVPVYDNDNNVIAWYDPDTGHYWAKDMSGIIMNPTWNEDPATGYKIIRDGETGSILYYYDPKTGTYYASDKTTVIENPYLPEYDIKKDGKDFKVRYDTNGRVLYFMDVAQSKYYYAQYDDYENIVCYANQAGNMYYDADFDEIPEFNTVRNGKTYKLMRDVRGREYYLYDVEAGVRYFAKYDEQNAFLFLCYYDKSADRYYDSDIVPIPESDVTINGRAVKKALDPKGRVLYYRDPATDICYRARYNDQGELWHYFDPATGKHYDNDFNEI